MLRLPQLLVTLLVISLLSGCEKRDKNTVKISVKIDSAANARIDILTTNMLNLDTLLLASSSLDSNGSGKIELNIASPIFATVVTSSDQHIPIYINPGDELTIESDINTSKNDFHFAGSSAAVNHFLRLFLDAVQQVERFDEKNVIDIVDNAEFFGRIKTYRKKCDELFISLKAEKSIDAQTLKTLASYIEMTEYYFYQKYTQSRYGFYMDDPEIPKELLERIKNFPDDSIALSTNMFSYGMILINHLQSGILAKVERHVEGWDSRLLDNKYPHITDSLIQKEAISKPLIDYFRAANINYWVQMEGLSPSLETLRATFTKEVAVPQYTAQIKKSFALWQHINPGKPAPDFTGQTAEGKNLSLSDLKGKVVYIDVWQPGAARAEMNFPILKRYSKRLKAMTRWHSYLFPPTKMWMHGKKCYLMEVHLKAFTSINLKTINQMRFGKTICFGAFQDIYL